MSSHAKEFGPETSSNIEVFVICTKCKEEKPAEEFYHGRQCRQCRAIYQTAWIAKHPEARKARDARALAWNRAHPDRARAAVKKSTQKRKAKDPRGWARKKNRDGLLYWHQLPPEKYDAMLAEQRGACAICEESSFKQKRWKRFAVDHDHFNGKIRGLLCHRCNIAVGMLESKIGNRILTYLRRYDSRPGYNEVSA